MKFRKKPIVIEAEQFIPSNRPWPRGVYLAGSDPHDPLAARDAKKPHNTPYVFDMPEGRLFLKPGDWIITGVKGERYPCPQDVFEASYEPVP